MKRSELQYHLTNLDTLRLQLPDGSHVPAHFHITEAGLTTKSYIDCGGTVRHERYLTLQVWTAEDTDHRLTGQKLNRILELAEPVLGRDDLPVIVEYQSDTVGMYDLEFDPSTNSFLLNSRHTDCLAKEHCGIPETSELEMIGSGNSSCTPGGGCC